MRLMRTTALFAATFGLAAISLGACTGLPDKGFGANGIKVLTGTTAASATVLPTGNIMISAFKPNSLNNFVYRFDANGTIDATYANHGVLSLGPGSVLIGHGGRAMLFASNAQATKVTPYTAAGAIDHGFANGLLSLAPSFSNSGAALSSAGDLYIWSCTSKVLVASCGLHHYNAAGQADTGFLYALPGDNYGYIEGFGLDGGIFVLSYLGRIRATPSHFILTKLTHTGSPDPTFGNHGSIALPADLAVGSVAVTPTGRVTMLVSHGLVTLLFRFTSLGQADRTFGWLGMAGSPYGVNSGPLAVDAYGRVIITSSGSSSLSPLEVARLQPNGQLDPKFGFAGKVSLSKVGSADL